MNYQAPGYQGLPQDPGGFERASFSRRGFAPGAPLPVPTAAFGVRLGANVIDGVIVWIVGAVIIGASGPNGTGGGVVLALVFAAAYCAGFQGRSGQTPGQRALGIRVVDRTTGGPIGYGRALLRLVVSWLSAMAFCIGYLWMLWDRDRQTWHDKAADCLVVPAPRI
jgi:uncharacterized RDD family membrane protein YckC